MLGFYMTISGSSIQSFLPVGIEERESFDVIRRRSPVVQLKNTEMLFKHHEQWFYTCRFFERLLFKTNILR